MHVLVVHNRYNSAQPSGENRVVDQEVALLRAAAAQCGVTEIAQRGERLNFALRDPDLARISALAGAQVYRGRLLFSAGDKPYLSLKIKKGEDPVKLASKLIQEYGAAAV